MWSACSVSGLSHSLDEPLQTRSTDNCTARSPGCRRPEWAPTPRGHWTELTGPVSEGLSAPTGHPHPLAWQPLCPQAQHQDPWHTSSHTLTLVGRTHASRDHQMRGLQSPIHTEPGCGVGERQGGCTHRGPWELLETAPASALYLVCAWPHREHLRTFNHHLSQELSAGRCGSRCQYKMLNILLPTGTPDLLLHTHKFPLKWPQVNGETPRQPHSEPHRLAQWPTSRGDWPWAAPWGVKGVDASSGPQLFNSESSTRLTQLWKQMSISVTRVTSINTEILTRLHTRPGHRKLQSQPAKGTDWKMVGNETAVCRDLGGPRECHIMSEESQNTNTLLTCTWES